MLLLFMDKKQTAAFLWEKLHQLRFTEIIEIYALSSLRMKTAQKIVYTPYQN
jgi:hypothetical protein